MNVWAAKGVDFEENILSEQKKELFVRLFLPLLSSALSLYSFYDNFFFHIVGGLGWAR